jgi:16S rRNA (guanine527-N7)-methyltransferase
VEAIVAARHIEAAASDAGPIRWMDLGSGGGSPAIPLKIVRPTWYLTMVEAKERKASFLREAIRMLRLQGADVANARFEDLGREGTADVVTVRAVKVDRPFADVVRRLLTPQGVLAVFSSTAVMLDGFESEHSRALIPDASAVLTLLRVPLGT